MELAKVFLANVEKSPGLGHASTYAFFTGALFTSATEEYITKVLTKSVPSVIFD